MSKDTHVKWLCFGCNGEFITGAKTKGNRKVKCPYCQCGDIEDLVYLSAERLQDDLTGCLGITLPEPPK